MFLKKYIDTYQKIGFERLDLFQAINHRYHPETVLYPGSSLHITPSFVFQNVTYIDPSPLASDFFKQKKEIEEFVQSRAQYKQKPFIQYFNCHIENLDKSKVNKFELIFSSFSGNMIESSWKFLKHQGIYISNNHSNELLKINFRENAVYEGYFSYKNMKCIFTETNDPASIKEPPIVYKNNKTSGVYYLQNERYYSIKKMD